MDKWKKLVDFAEGKVEMDGGMLDPLETKQIHDQIQQNLIKLTNHKNKLGLFLVGNFRIWGRTHKIRLENKEGRL